MGKLAVGISTQAYRANNIKLPSAYKQMNAYMLAGPAQLTAQGLTSWDRTALNLSAANAMGIKIFGALFVTTSGLDVSGQEWST